MFPLTMLEERLTSVKDRINRLNISLQSQSTKKEQDPKTFNFQLNSNL